MINVVGYQISEQISQNENSIVYRADREQDNLPVILKILRQKYPTPIQLTRYKQEYEITHKLNLEGVVKAYSLERHQNKLAIVFEDFGGESLRILLKRRKLILKEFLQLAIAITDALGNLHAANIIHKDINPAHIVYNSNTKQLKIIDFGISTCLTQENFTIKNSKLLEGTLTYSSPEQTGRMNRSLDYRSDFYSLGITFYELLTGKLPFETQDSLELIYCHLAKTAIPPHLIVKEGAYKHLRKPQMTAPPLCESHIPQVVSDIIMKLMAKTAEERYQSAWGIKADLEECLQQLETTGVIKQFTLARKDKGDRFIIPEKLYGREKEVGSLLAAFERIAGKKNKEANQHNEQKPDSEIIFVSGYSGIGKSSLVKEIYQPITQKKGYFISGKFDQYQRDIPYYAIIQAFSQLIEQLLTQTEAQLKQWRDKIKTALGVNGQVIVDIIPELELIIGKQQAIPELQASEAHNRFNLVFQNFIAVFTQKEHPLVIFLDDLQWADLASLKLMKLLINAPNVSSLLLIGAYRDNEVSATHPLMLTLREIKETRIAVNEIILSPLKIADSNQLIADTLRSALENTIPLSNLLAEKTGNNPFFLKEFLKILCQENLLKLNSDNFDWQWNLNEIKAQKVTDNVVDLMTSKIQKLPVDTQKILKLGACIGNQFDINTLAIVAEKSTKEIALSLAQAIAQGLIFPLNYFDNSVEYKFIHDKIQQAAYSLIDLLTKPVLHLQIGRLLLKKTNWQQQSEKIFKIVNQLNMAQALIIEPAEREKLAKLNVIASKKAKASNAYQSALEYLQIGINFLDTNSWQKQYQLSLEIHQVAAETAYLSGDFEQMEKLIEIVFQKAITLSDKVKVYEVKIQAYIALDNHLLAANTGLDLLKLLGINFPKKTNKLNILLALVKIKLSLVGKKTEDLISLPIMAEPKKKSAMKILTLITPSVHAIFPQIFPLLVFKQINLSITYGNTTSSTYAYAHYSLILCGILRDIEAGYQFGQLALNLSSKFAFQETKARTLMIVYGFIHHWKKHYNQASKFLWKAYQIGLETGEFESAALCLLFYSNQHHSIVKNLVVFEQELASFIIKTIQIRQFIYVEFLQIDRQVVLNLIGRSNIPWHLKGIAYDEEKVAIQSEKIDRYSILNFYFYFNKATLCYLFEQYSQAIRNADLAKKYLKISTLSFSILCFYDSLARLALYEEAEKSQQKNFLLKVRSNQKKMKKWAHHAPMNFLHKFYLVEAEKHRVIGKYSQAIHLYDRAIKLAHENEYIKEEALAYELAAKFYLGRSNSLIATTYMKQARHCYQRWGANAKVKQLNENYPELLVEISESFNNQNTAIPLSTKQQMLDLATLIKTSQALAQIKDLGQLLETLVKFVLENAGAEKGFLILVQSDSLVIQAKGTTEEIITLQSVFLDDSNYLSKTIINYVYRTQENIVLDNACSEGLFINDEYIISNQIKSVLCSPILNQGKVSGILYLENNLAENVFNAERLEILKLISAQAAISIKNALFRQQEREKVYEYQVGGSMSMDAPYYVVRSADFQLYNALKQGKFCYILNARQMGKSSLMVRMIHNLQQQGYRCTAIDLTRISNENITPEQWYKGLAVELWQGFDLFDRVNLKTWWNERQDLSLIQRFSQFIEEVLLVETRAEDNLSQPPIVIFFDEIDSVLSLNFAVDDLFALIRSCYNQRSINQEYRRLTFALLGVATPSNLISDRQQTPFNIGQAIQLEGFKLHEAQPLQVGLQSKTSNPQLLLEEVLAWTNGQPFLTQKLCQLIRSDSVSVPTNNLAKWIEQFVRTHVIKNWQSQDEPEHLKTIRNRLLSNEQKIGFLLVMYQQILQRGFIATDNSIEQQELMLSGLIIKQRGNLIVRNRIYQEVFNLLWVEAQLSQLRPYSEAFQAWQNSQHTDTSRLLRGKALQDSQKWSRGKSLSDLDYRFLASSEELDRQEAQQAFEAERTREIEARLLEKQRTNRLQRSCLIALGIGLSSALGFGAIAYGQYRQAAFNEIKALSNYSEALFASNSRLPALITAIKVKQKWQQLDYQDENTDNQIESVLRQAVYGIDEYNRLSGHTEVVFSVDISPNGQLIATGSSDRTVKLWKPDGTLINTFQGHQSAVWDVAFSPDGKTIASASRDRTVKLWGLNGRLLNTLKGHQDEVVGISFSPDGQTIASASRDHTVKLWDRDGNVIDTLSGHQSSVWKAVFSPDDQMIVTASEDKTVKLWKIDAQGRFKLYQTLRGHTDEIRDVAFSPDGQTIASVSHDQTAKLWEASSGKLLHTLEGHSSPVLGVVFSPDNQIVATTGWDGMVKVFNLEGALLKTINIDKKRIWDIDISLDGNSIATASEQDLVKLSKLDNPLLKVLRSHSAPIIDVAFNPQGNIIATASDDRTVKLWSKNGSLLTTFKSKQDSVLGIAWNPDGHRLASGHWNGAINFLQVKNLNHPQVHLDKTIPGHKVGVWRIAVSPNGKLIATASEDKTAKIWDWQGNLITSLIGHQDVVRAVAFSPDNQIVATASYDKTVKLWTTQGKIIATLKKNNNDLGAGALNISPDGKMMATADLEGTIKLWQIEQEQGRVSVKLNKTLKGHTEEVRKIIFSPDGRLIASANEDSTIKIWHRSGKLLKIFYGHEAAVWSLAFSPDGKTLASVSEDQTVIIWNLQQMFELDLLAAGCNQIEDYLQTNAEVSQSDRFLCDRSDKSKKKLSITNLLFNRS
jgi:predicted ATPase/WD40 repeat protein/GAF domain-containing protein/tRNA A-37 threonylcarbamoyl transferase component Bud32